jgi:hypothetical protein
MKPITSLLYIESLGTARGSLVLFRLLFHGNLYKVWNRMSSGSYFPPPVKAVAIPKRTDGERIFRRAHCCRQGGPDGGQDDV